MIKTIIFDLGGVLIDWNPRYLYRKLFGSDAEVEEFLANICTSDWNEEQDGGRSTAEGTRILVEKFPEQRVAIEAFYGRWAEMLGESIAGTVRILQEVCNDPRYQVVALTNWSAETWPIAVERFDFLQWFEGILVSGQEGLKKPDAAIYALVLERFQIDAESAIFIDDNQRNVDSAIQCGIPSIHFTSPDELRKALLDLGVL